MLDNQGYLKLKADDKNDLKVFAAYLQDSITVPQDIKYLEKNRAFICVFNRFMWEDAEKGVFRDNKRIRSAFKINDIHSEYGMTELLSQAYSKKNGIFTTPPWMKVLTRDVYDPLSINTEKTNGGINIIDLANIYSCSFIATDDLGVLISENEFKLNGRISNADIRGCNQLIQ